MIYELAHFKEHSGGECKEIQFYSVDSLIDYLDDEVEDDGNTVYLLSYHNHIFVNEDLEDIIAYLNAHIYDDDFSTGDLKEIHLQHYDSYESAYEVALDIMEGVSALTYAPDNKEFLERNGETTFSIN